MEKNDNNSSISSLIPVMLIGGLAIILMQFFNTKKPQKKPEPPPIQEETTHEAPVEQNSNIDDFSFAQGSDNRIEIDAGYLAFLMNAKGGRIDRLYLKNNDMLRIPKSVVRESHDDLAVKYNAIEITRDNGLDFQPHLYYTHPVYDYIWQVKQPPMDSASFTMEGPYRDAVTGIQEVRFKTPIRFKDYDFELIKVYRFLKNEYFFRQITAIRNLTNRQFELKAGDNIADLYFKPFGDIGPTPHSKDRYTLASYGRFYYYNDSMENAANISGGGGMSCSLLGCGGTHKGPYYPYVEFPNTLNILGSKSRYFMGYTKFMAPESESLSKPDGLVYVYKIDPTGKETFTAIFQKFALAPSTGEPLDLGSVDGDHNVDGKLLPKEESNFSRVRKTQMRKDALVIDQKVYFGVKRDESHVFTNGKLAAAEFGSSDIDNSLSNVFYSNPFMVFFAPVKDVVVWMMRIIYKLTGNYGWAIIIIAVGFKLITWPLNQSQAKMMKKMASLKPEMEALNEKYADNPQEKQKKTMELYSKHKVNPAKGCLPIIIQIPIFIALFYAFSDSVELWRSPFIFWIKDLSQPDTLMVIPDLIFIKDFHLNILPLFMVTTQLLQQLTTTVSTDPQQRMMMYMMPFIMIIFFWSMPSGVTLYWTVQNVVTILWQVIGSRMSKDEN